MKRLVIFIIIMLTVGSELFAQVLPFTRDHSFKLDIDFDFGKDTVVYINGSAELQDGGPIEDVWEDPSNGKLYIVGDFGYHDTNGNFYSEHLCFKKDGTFYKKFYPENFGAADMVFPINDSTFYSSESGSGRRLFDSLGAIVNLPWHINFSHSVPCENSAFPYFFEDGSSLWVNRDNKAFPKHCNPRIPPDTFPHEPIVKIDTEGNFDSTFSADTDISYANFGRYDSNRIMMYAPTRFIYNYDNRTVNGVWRINHDGSLDTTFNAPISDAWADGGFHRAPIVLKDGKMLLTGYFL